MIYIKKDNKVELDSLFILTRNYIAYIELSTGHALAQLH